MFTMTLFYEGHKPSKQANKQIKQPNISNTENMNKLWDCNLRKRPSLALIVHEYYLVVYQYISSHSVKWKKLVIIDKNKIR